jgi:hypothetical protein
MCANVCVCFVCIHRGGGGVCVCCEHELYVCACVSELHIICFVIQNSDIYDVYTQLNMEMCDYGPRVAHL